MARIVRRLLSSALLVCVIAAPGSIAASGSLNANDAGAGSNSVQPQSIHAGTQVAYRRMEVRLRRLHLVRPDLIPYPIAYEIIC
ncbi:MAG TPA: hypothetical protein VGG44_08245 [Tepidisphaeraceae bacterium]|jgi:hypothetical protein